MCLTQLATHVMSPSIGQGCLSFAFLPRRLPQQTFSSRRCCRRAALKANDLGYAVRTPFIDLAIRRHQDVKF